ncbi:MAG: hypothetical protein OXC44_01525 [Proteobacteria bacterium]|nr:hypothetical protein [Pseudomonadota bacterium]
MKHIIQHPIQYIAHNMTTTSTVMTVMTAITTISYILTTTLTTSVLASPKDHLEADSSANSNIYLLKHDDQFYDLTFLPEAHHSDSADTHNTELIFFPHNPSQLQHLAVGATLPISAATWLNSYPSKQAVWNPLFKKLFQALRLPYPHIQTVGLSMMGLAGWSMVSGYLVGKRYLLQNDDVFASENSQDTPAISSSSLTTTSDLDEPHGPHQVPPHPLSFLTEFVQKNRRTSRPIMRRVLVHDKKPVLYELQKNTFFELGSPHFYFALKQLYHHHLDESEDAWQDYKVSVEQSVDKMNNNPTELYIPEGYKKVTGGHIRLAKKHIALGLRYKYVVDNTAYLFFNRVLAPPKPNQGHLQPHPLDITPFTHIPEGEPPRRVLLKKNAVPLYELEKGRFYELGSYLYEDTLQKRYRFAYFKNDQEIQQGLLEDQHRLPHWKEISEQLDEETERVLDGTLDPYIPKGYIVVLNSDIRLYKDNLLFDKGAYFFHQSSNPFLAGRYFIDETPQGKKGRSHDGDSHSDIGVPGMW